MDWLARTSRTGGRHDAGDPSAPNRHAGRFAGSDSLGDNRLHRIMSVEFGKRSYLFPPLTARMLSSRSKSVVLTRSVSVSHPGEIKLADNGSPR